MRLTIALLAFAIALPASAELPVAYDVQAKALKRSLAFGDPLTFELFDAPDCVSAGPLFSEVLGAGTPGVSVEQVSRLRAKKEPRGPAVARLRATLGIETIDRPLYLKVSGDGIEPVGAACQLQVPAVVGFPGPPGPRGQAGASMRVFDGTGQELGAAIQWPYVYNTALRLVVDLKGFLGAYPDPIHFSLPGCTGQAYVWPNEGQILGSTLVGVPPDLFLTGATLVVDASYQSLLRFELGPACDTLGAPAVIPRAIPATPYDGLPFVAPLAEPLYYAPGE